MISNRKVNNSIITGIKVFFSDVDGTLTDGCTYYSSVGEEMKRFNHKDGRGNFLLRQNEIRFGIITGENSEIVTRRAEKLNADFCFLGITNKLEFISSFCTKNKITIEEVAFIGDDTNDLEIMENVGLSFAVADAMPEIKNAAHYVCSRNGGDGAFREAVDFIIKSRKITITTN